MPEGTRITATDEWREWVSLHSDPDPMHAWNARALTSSLYERCSRDDVAVLLQCCRSHDPRERAAGLYVLLSLQLRNDARLEPAAAQALEHVAAELARTELPTTQAGTLALQTWFDIRPEAADAFLDERYGYESRVSLETTLSFPVLGGGHVTLGPGLVESRVRFSDLPLYLGVSDATTVVARVDVTDARGGALRAHALVTGCALFERLRWSPVAWPSQGGTPVLPALRADLDYRDYIPLCAPTARGAEPVILWAKHLTALVTLGRDADDARHTLIAATSTYGRLSAGEWPPVSVSGDWALHLALTAAPLLFWPLDHASVAPQQNVRLVAELPSAAVWNPGDLDWRTLAVEELRAHWREASHREWVWRRVLQSIDLGLLESLAVARESGDKREHVWSVASVLDSLATSGAIERLEQLAQTADFTGDHARQVLARRGVRHDARILELAARRGPSDLWWIEELLRVEPRPTQEEVRRWLGDPTSAAGDHWAYEWVLPQDEGLKITWTAAGVLQFSQRTWKQAPAPRPEPEPELAAHDEVCQRFSVPVVLAASVEGGGSLVIPRAIQLWGYMKFHADGPDALAATLEIADQEGRTYQTRRTLDAEDLLALLLQTRTCLYQRVPKGTRLVGDLRPRWSKPTVLAGLVVRDGEPGFVDESGFDVGGDVLLELWGSKSIYAPVTCCLRNVARVDLDPPCDVVTELPALPAAIIAPWLCRREPATEAEPTLWRRTDRVLLPQPDAVYEPA